MAIVSKSHTFAAGATIIASEHNTNFDSLYNLINGNLDNDNIDDSAAIAASKLNLAAVAQSMTFTGTLDFSGATITAGFTAADLTITSADINGGTIDATNIGTTTSADALFSSATIGTLEASNIYINGETTTGMLMVTNSSDNVDGLGSQGTSGQILKSAGAGSNPTWSDSTFKLVSNTTLSTTNSGDIAISANKTYKVYINLTTAAGDSSAIYLRFNSQSDAADYAWAIHGLGMASSDTEYRDSDNEDSQIALLDLDTLLPGGDHFMAELTIHTTKTDSKSAFVTGQVNYEGGANNYIGLSVYGVWLEDATVSSFEIVSSAQNMTGSVVLYELARS